MGRYLLFFSYLGHRYRGLQKQASDPHVLDVDCIQGAIENSFSKVKPIIVNGPKFISSSRTDSGVHSFFNAAHVELDNAYGLYYHPESLMRFMNRHLLRCYHEIRILNCIPITDQFHARFNAKSRTYYYRFAVAKSPEMARQPAISELNRCSTVRFDEFDIEKLKQGLKHFVGVRDFQTFAVTDRENKKKVYRREVLELSLEKANPLLSFDPQVENFDFYHIKCRGISFVHNQIRRMVGALFALAGGKLTERELITMLQVPSSQSWESRLVPAVSNGLYLVNIEYDPDELKENTIIYNEKEFLKPFDFDK